MKPRNTTLSHIKHNSGSLQQADIVTHQLLKKNYKTYSKILANVIKEAKSLYYDNQLTNSTNNIKTTGRQ